MNLIQRVTERVFKAFGAVEQKRMYASAKSNRLVGDWTTQNFSANQEIRYAIKVVRARSRQLAKDDDYFIGYLRKLKSYVVGAYGIRLQADAKRANGTPDEIINKAVEEKFNLWAKKDFCTVTGQDSFIDVQQLFVRTLAVDGEVLIRVVADTTSPFGFRLQMLDVDWLDEDFNEQNLSNGNRIVMSIELDQFDKPVAYWLSQPRWGSWGLGDTPVVPRNTDRLRVPAHQIIHRFVRERVGQVRGMPWAHSAMLRMNMLGGYEEAELVGARVAASQMMIVSAPTDETAIVAPGTPATEKVNSEVAPGMIKEIPAGYTVHDFTPSRPGNTYPVFIKSILRAIAVSLGISYFSLASDLESTSYSSIRAGTIEDRDIYKMYHTWTASHLCQDVFKIFMMFNTSIVPMSKLMSVMYPKWRARGFDWVDPSKDVNADIMAVDRGFKTLADVISERGGDFEDVMRQHAYEKEFIEGLGLKFVSTANQPQPDGEDDGQDTNGEDKKKKAKDKK